MGMISAVLRGAAAGAVGTCAINAATYADMAWRGRPPSTLPQQAVARLAEQMGRPIPGEGETLDNRLTGLGSLAGVATGVGLGTVVGLSAPIWRRMPVLFGSALLGGAAMAVTDGQLVRLGLTDPRSWSATDWASDGVPHFCYGLATLTTLRALRRPRRLPTPEGRG